MDMTAIFSAYVATTTAFVVAIMTAMFNAFFTLLLGILPFGIGIFVFYLGWRWIRGAMNGGL